MTVDTQQFNELRSALRAKQLSPTTEKAALRVIKRLSLLSELLETAGEKRVLWAAAFGKGVIWLKQHRSERSLKGREVEILIVVKGDYFEANEALSQSVFGPLLEREEWLPRYHIWTEQDLSAAKAEQHTAWVRLQQGYVVCYRSRQFKE